jgi:CheY-like chemotaxis protein
MPTTQGNPDVLIAEDDDLVRRSLRQLLEQQGYTCAEASDGRAAVDLARQQLPHCLLLDLGLPLLDGFGVARALRADPRTRGVRIHCLTGLSGPGVRQQADQVGVKTVLTKPVDPARLLDALRDQAPGQETVSGLSKSQAEDLLDWLQAHGCHDCSVEWEEGQGFCVRHVPLG